MDAKQCDVIIIGGGPAGLTAAIYAGRAQLNTVVIEKGEPGGQAATTLHIANYPGTRGVISGEELAANMVRQTQAFGVKVLVQQEVVRVELDGDIKIVSTQEQVFHAPVVIIATGLYPRQLPAVGAEKWRARGVHYCAICDGPLYEGRNLVVVGGGASAVQETLFLTRYAAHITLIHEFDRLQAAPVAQRRILDHPKVDFIWNSHVREVLGNGQVTGVRIEDLQTGEMKTVPADGIFVYIGMEPHTEIFRGQLDLSPEGYIITDSDMRTNLSGVFAAGDVREKKVRQVITAAADGAVAARSAERYLNEVIPADLRRVPPVWTDREIPAAGKQQ